MKNEVLAHLHDTVQAGKALKTFVAGRTFEHYTSDEQLRSAVERKFEIMGEALNRIHRDEPAVLEHIRDHRDVISFRNILIHGYDAIDDRIVWGVIEDDLDNLIEDAEALLDEDQDRTAASNATSG
jgi:uncharacterized protein with HEPN domain